MWVNEQRKLYVWEPSQKLISVKLSHTDIHVTFFKRIFHDTHLHQGSKPQWWRGCWPLKCCWAQPPDVAVTAVVFYCVLEDLSFWFMHQDFTCSLLYINTFLSTKFSPSVFVPSRDISRSHSTTRNLYIWWYIHKFLNSMLGLWTASKTDFCHYVPWYFCLLSQSSDFHNYNLFLCCLVGIYCCAC